MRKCSGKTLAAFWEQKGTASKKPERQRKNHSRKYFAGKDSAEGHPLGSFRTVFFVHSLEARGA